MKTRIFAVMLACLLAFSSVLYRPAPAYAAGASVAAIPALAALFMQSQGYSWMVNGMDQSGFTDQLAGLIQDYVDSLDDGTGTLTMTTWASDIFYHVAVPGVVSLGKTAVEKLSGFVNWLIGEKGITPGSSAVISGSVPLSFTFTSAAKDVFIFDWYSSSITTIKSYLYLGNYGSQLFITSPTTITISTSSLPDKSMPYLSFLGVYSSLDSQVVQDDLGNSVCLWSTGGTALVGETYSFTITQDMLDSYDYWFSLSLCLPSTIDSGGTYSVYNPFIISFSGLSSLSVDASSDAAVISPDSLADDGSLEISTGLTGSTTDDLLQQILDAVLAGTLTTTATVTDVPTEGEGTWQDILAGIGENIRTLPQTITDAVAGALASAFAPDEALITEMTSTFNGKFGFLATLHDFASDLFGQTADTSPPVIYIHLEDAEGQFTYGGTEVALDLSWYQRYKGNVDTIISGFLWIGFLWLLFKRAAAIIRGGEMISEYSQDLDAGSRGSRRNR